MDGDTKPAVVEKDIQRVAAMSDEELLTTRATMEGYEESVDEYLVKYMASVYHSQYVELLDRELARRGLGSVAIERTRALNRRVTIGVLVTIFVILTAMALIGHFVFHSFP
jgi:hypothetical protein